MQVACVPAMPGAEVCANGLDDDCDGLVDEPEMGVVFDEFDGNALGPQWNQDAVGTPPTFTVSGSIFQITEAATAVTPSFPGNSWIYDLDVDLGNQMAWPIPIGVGKLDVWFDFSWESSVTDLTLAGIGLTSSSNQLEVFAGIGDGSDSDIGKPFVWVRQPGSDAVWGGGLLAATGGGNIQLTRVGNVLTAKYDGAIVLTTTLDADIQNVVIQSVRHATPGPVLFDWGTFALDRVHVCY
jgi:hypothetical protein